MIFFFEEENLRDIKYNAKKYNNLLIKAAIKRAFIWVYILGATREKKAKTSDSPIFENTAVVEVWNKTDDNLASVEKFIYK